ncbi:hypothetical protein SAMN05660330_04404 [Desulforhopalus singaporensis]|uniref:Uncharacterized protein n=1 Tax=Desulforhopalus singaporensis TaxID=91360 RepID=A0A1H0W4E8_9BACT|nr:hypothetical protein SAMN05660330_04404 [Desulforhopalus singaporensis]
MSVINTMISCPDRVFQVADYDIELVKLVFAFLVGASTSDKRPMIVSNKIETSEAINPAGI